MALISPLKRKGGFRNADNPLIKMTQIAALKLVIHEDYRGGKSIPSPSSFFIHFLFKQLTSCDTYRLVFTASRNQIKFTVHRATEYKLGYAISLILLKQEEDFLH